MGKKLKRTGLVFGSLFALTGLLLAWLIAAESGARFTIASVESLLGGKLTVAEVRGALNSPLELRGVRYRDDEAGVDASIDSLKIDYAFSSLLGMTLHISDLSANNVNVALTTVPPKPDDTPLQDRLTPPLDILLDRLYVGKLAVSQDGKPVFASDRLDAAATWTASALTITQFALRAPDSRLDLTGELTDYARLQGHAQLDVDWRIDDKTRATGQFNFNHDGKLARLTLALEQPFVANANGALSAQDDALPWTLSLVVPEFDPSPLNSGLPLKSFALNLSGAGDKQGGTLNGDFDLNAHRVLLDPLKFTLVDQLLTIEQLHLHAPKFSGVFDAQGKIHLDAQPLKGDIALDWTGVVLPADLVGQTLATHGHLTASGDAQNFQAQGKLAAGPPDHLADLDFRLDGTPDKIQLQRFDLKQPQGGLHISGVVRLQPQIGWNLTADADRLNPGLFMKDWPGSINFALNTDGNMQKDGAAGKIKLDNLSGVLRGRPLSGSADLAFSPPFKAVGNLRLSSGNSRVSLDGTNSDMRIHLGINSLGDWLPNASGSLRGDISLRGEWPKMDATGHIAAAGIAQGETKLETLGLDIDVRDLSAPSGKVALNGKNIAAAGYAFDTLAFNVDGNQAAHRANLNIVGRRLSLATALTGSMTQDGNAWRGTLQTLTLNTGTRLPPWTLTRPTTLSYANGAFELEELCLASAEQSSLCASVQQVADGGLRTKFDLKHLPLRTMTRFASPDSPVRLDGELNGNGAIDLSADGVLNGQATLDSEAGTLTYPDLDENSLLSWSKLRLRAQFSPQQYDLTLGSDLDDGGRIDGHIVTAPPRDGDAPLSGKLSARINKLSVMDMLVASMSSTSGYLDADFSLSGSMQKPGMKGQLTLVDFATEIPAAGLKLRDGNVTVSSSDAENFNIDGSVASTEGKLALKGHAGLAPDAPILLTLSGENFLAANIPGVSLHVSPDLKLERTSKRFLLSGAVAIPRLTADLSKLPNISTAAGASVPKVSSDVVIVGEEAPPPKDPLPIEVDITLKLGVEQNGAVAQNGRRVHLLGYGLDSDLSGQLVITQAVNRPPVGRGQINLTGTFQAYGQNLRIEQGRLLFAGTPVEDPGLDIRAVRANMPDSNTTVGLQVRGTASRPTLTVFSDPAMEQSDALAFLVTGKPLSQIQGGESSAVSNAASTLGTLGGSLLAQNVGEKMGLDDVSVDDNASVGGAVLTIGKYLSPRLYLSYGVGLFTPGQVVTLRYRISRLFDFEMQNGTLSSRAGLNYRTER
ncbi:MAG: translocation/assembly module TamB domain-containing protein [Gallionellaceae bacterium]|jgi:translocation and assembly module TamB|nr:translocation/assembly module TamB domain-containing protein [Gallionellaceae bacterium]